MATHRRALAVLFVAAAALARPIGGAQAGSGYLHPEFGTNGVAMIDPGGVTPSYATAVARQADGKLVVAGATSPAQTSQQGLVTRLLANGQPDPSFTTFTMEGVDQHWPTHVAIQTDGKIVVSVGIVDSGASVSRVDLVRLNSTGQLDPTFGVNGFVTGMSGAIVGTQLAGMALQPDGKILVAHATPATGDPADRSRMLVRRHNADGSLDATFGVGGVATVTSSTAADPHDDWAFAVAVLPSGGIAVGGGSAGANTIGWVVGRLTSMGAVDASFGTGGTVRTSFPDHTARVRDMVVQPDGKLVVTGDAPAEPGTNDRLVVARYTTAGALDPAFGSGGLAAMDVPGAPAYGGLFTSIALGPGGKIDVVGTRVSQDGTLGQAVVRQLLGNGQPDPTFGGDGTVLLPQSQALAVLVDPYQQVIVAGVVDRHMAVAKVEWATQAATTGWNAVGQLGVGGATDSKTPAPALFGADAVAAGAFHSLVTKGDGSLWAFGWNGVGQLGDGTTTDQHSPVRVPINTPIVKVSAGAYHSLALGYDGSLWSFGWNGVGMLGNGANVDAHSPVHVMDGVVDVSAGMFHSLAVKADGTVWAWGWNPAGELGDGTTTDRWSPVQVSGLTNVVAVAGGGYHSVALKSDGTVWAWGWNAVGQLGDGTTVDRHTPVQVPGLAGVKAIASGAHHVLAIMNDGTVKAWGWNAVSQLGDGTTTDRHLPVTVPGLSNIAVIAAGAYHSLAADVNGLGKSWGWNGVGQLGVLVSGEVIATPTVMANAHGLAAGLAHSVIVQS